MEAMRDRDGQYFLRVMIHIDDAYFGGELNGGKAGRGSENMISFVAALEMSGENRPIYLRLNRVCGFTSDSIEAWSQRVWRLGASCFLMVWLVSGL